ncbi:hypothetical protein [Clostridium sp. Marseille-Q7071]
MKNVKNNIKKIRIVIIDSGINTKKDYLRNSAKEEIGFELNKRLQIETEYNLK